ncbi:type II toxin-antitoxin system VapC family toxin [Chelativorans sp. AA-79]|uniref:type II toxin-antitoxin system VapC family toxin n=1 Tax=Chelativorans sp. AA-79 TaxID=3028735 RepID=UPI0023F8EA67|nr:type II toxin-antitoxin system VapC family toxin [Chelativorans sp. AA-79]WEX07887.1 type II toxin-antitoxin system VapC family toxin [Chelativorans sp. AA-79]
MKFLLDTRLLLWAADQPDHLSKAAREILENTSNELIFSAASLWEVSIKSGLGRADFQADAWVLRRGLLDHGYVELPITGAHAVAVRALPSIHKDPFDRILVAQAMVEGITLLTTDTYVAEYPGPVQRV